jgi:3-oxoacyl-[acyl-carrier protein] reductase
MVDLGLSGKGAFVSGAGYIPERAGHGRSCSLKLAEAGATVACVDIDRSRVEGTALEITKSGGTAVPIVADMTLPLEVQRTVDEAVRELGRIDACVDIIGGARWEKVETISVEDWQWTMLNNVTQVFYLFQIREPKDD